MLSCRHYDTVKSRDVHEISAIDLGGWSILEVDAVVM
jgi:hypothetical protein